MSDHNQYFLLANECALDDDGWALIAPYGDWPKTRVLRQGGRAVDQHFIQVLDNDAAQPWQTQRPME
jgi:hypothetical protein